MVNQKHDLIIIYCHDNIDCSFSLNGLINLENVEDKSHFSFLGNKRGQKIYLDQKKKIIQDNITLCYRNGIDIVSISDDEDYLPALKKFFKRRGAK